jgi:pyruvate dehydrogenase E1 component beta subunit
LVADEDYKGFGLSGELAAMILEAGIGARYARVCVENTIPYDIRREARALPNVQRIVAAAHGLL